MKKLFDFIRDELFGGLNAEVNLSGGQKLKLRLSEETSADGRILSFIPDGTAEKLLDRFEIRVTEGTDTAVFSVQADAHFEAGQKRAFMSEGGIVFSFGDAEPDAAVASAHDNPWWMLPHFYGKQKTDTGDLSGKTQSLLLRFGNEHVHLYPLTGDSFRAEIDGKRLCLNAGTAGLYHLSGAFLAAGRSIEPQKAVSDNIAYAASTGAIRVPLRSERSYPSLFEGFGFCTWDCFYRDITSEKTLEKLDEFRAKKVPVQWIILDDGWLSVRNEDGRGMLTSFSEDRTKFPEGFKAFIAKIKEEYGIRHVGVWHAFNGYWQGVDPEGELYRAQRENLTETADGLWIPSFDEEKAFAFWDGWHSYLASCGVDFVKVDNQSSNSAYIEGRINTAEGCRIAHRALERSVSKNFGGNIINCMGMDMDNVLARPGTAVSRNSDDFFPRRERGFVKHLVQNVYNAVWHNELYYCDFDMWWSDHESAVQSGVLRAISGSPIYVSDETGRTDPERIRPVIEEDGTLMRCDYAARPTADRMYTDCVKEERLLTVWNRSGEAYALAAFNVCEKALTDTVNFGAIPELPDGPFAAYEFFTKTWQIIDRGTVSEITVPADESRIYSIYPIYNEESGDDYVMAGSTEKYLPIASKQKEKIYIRDILRGNKA